MTHEPDPDVAREAIEYCYEQGWTDGLPVVPASEGLLEEFLATTRRSPDEVLWRMDHLSRECTVRTAAINAAMAGCLPEYFPIVLGAWDAVMRDRAAKGGGWQSTSGSTARPKGVIYTQRMIMTYASEFALMEPRCARGSRILSLGPFSSASGSDSNFQFTFGSTKVLA